MELCKDTWLLPIVAAAADAFHWEGWQWGSKYEFQNERVKIQRGLWWRMEKPNFVLKSHWGYLKELIVLKPSAMGWLSDLSAGPAMG